MPDIVKRYLDRIKEFWDKYTARQKTIFIASVIGVLAFLIILGVVIAQPQTVILRYCTSATEATEVRELLTSNNIACTINSDFSVSINANDEVEAQLLLGSNNIKTEGFSINDAITGSFTMTASDTEKLYQNYLENKFNKIIEKIDGVKSAYVTIKFIDNGSTIFTEDTDSMINAVLTTTRQLDSSVVEGIAMFLGNSVGSDNTNNVVILDTTYGLLYSGAMDSSKTGTTSDLIKYREQLQKSIEAGVRDSVIATKTFSDVRVTANVALNYDSVSKVVREYRAPDGTEEGLHSTSYEVDSEGGTGAGGVAGAESNDDDTQYQFNNGPGSTSTYTLRQYDWLQNEYVTTTDSAAGTMVPGDSSLSVTLVRYIIVTQEELEAQGLLDDTTFEEYKAANGGSVRVDVDEDFIPLWAAGSGIPERNISVIGYEITEFIPRPESRLNTSFIIQIILAVLIVALLAFVVFRSARPVTVSETEPELSVEDMLASTREKQAPLDEIDLQDKSEARKAIEKFVQENPEAVAILLRNWLNEGWN